MELSDALEREAQLARLTPGTRRAARGRRRVTHHHHERGTTMTTIDPTRPLNGVDTDDAVRDHRRGARAARAGPLPVPDARPSGSAAPTTAPPSTASTAPAASTSRAGLHRRRRPPGGAGRRGPRAHAGRAPAAGARQLPDQRPGQHRRRARHRARRGHRTRRGRHRPARASSASTTSVRNGFEHIRVTFHVSGDGRGRAAARLVEQARRRSAVYDVLTHGVPVSDRRRHRLSRPRLGRPGRSRWSARIGRASMRAWS